VVQISSVPIGGEFLFLLFFKFGRRNPTSVRVLFVIVEAD
jgi:hypothetical protein